MAVRSVEKVNELFKKTLDETQEFIVEGYCSHGISKRTTEYRYSSLVDENCKFKIDLLEGEEHLTDGVFYILKVKFYSRKGCNEFRLKVIEVIEKFENKLLLNQDYFKVLKSKIDKGYVDIEGYLKSLIRASNQIKLGVITFRTSVAIEDIFKSLKKEHEELVLVSARYDIFTENFKNIFLKIKEEKQDVDLWVITRGGGDLTFFNSLELLKEITELNKPILTALGHSTDKTLSDLCSDRYFETPTSLGNYLGEILNDIKLEKEKNRIEKEKESNKYKEYNDMLSQKNNLEIQVKILKNKMVENQEKIIAQNNELTKARSEAELVKKILEISNSNNEILEKMSSSYSKLSFDFISQFKKLSPNAKMIVYIVCIVTFTKVILKI